MGDIGIDKWCAKMDEHRRKGHRIIKYGDHVTASEIARERFLRDRRARLWEQNKRIPTLEKLGVLRTSNETNGEVMDY